MHVQKSSGDCSTISAHIQNNKVGWCTESTKYMHSTRILIQIPQKLAETVDWQ
jgi:hypothetical protein